MILVVKSTNRVIDKLENFVKMYPTESKCDLYKIITESVSYIGLRVKIKTN